MPDTSLPTENGITKASRFAGGQVALAKNLNAGQRGARKHVSQQAVSQWVRQGFVPIDRAIEVSECVRNRIPPSDLIDPKLRQILNTMLPTPAAE